VLSHTGYRRAALVNSPLRRHRFVMACVQLFSVRDPYRSFPNGAAVVVRSEAVEQTDHSNGITMRSRVPAQRVLSGWVL